MIAVVDEGGVYPAARRLNIAQPTDSVAIGRLEKGYDIEIFDRAVSKALSLSDAGHHFVAWARIILREISPLGDVVKVVKSGKAFPDRSSLITKKPELMKAVNEQRKILDGLHASCTDGPE